MNNQFSILNLEERCNSTGKLKSLVQIIGLESFIWISALIYLVFFNDPFHQHFTICPLSNAGFKYCPGCGLGNSISLLLKGYFVESFKTHILGIPALIIIIHRVYTLINFNLKKTRSQIQ